MGYVAAFGLGGEGDDPAFLAEDTRLEAWGGFESPVCVETLHLARLWCLMEAADSEDRLVEHDEDLTETYCENDNGAWAVVLPRAFTESLAALDDTRASDLARLWGQSPEVRFDS